MALTYLVGALKGGDANAVTSDPIDTSGADLLVVSLAWYVPSTASPTISDSKGNSWDTSIPLELAGAAGDGHRMFFCHAPIVGSGHTFTYDAVGATHPLIGAFAFSGALTVAGLDQTNKAAGSGSTLQPGSVTPSEANELIVAGLSYGAAGAASIDSSFIEPLTEVSGTAFFLAMAYKIQTSAGAENPTWTFGSGGWGSAAVIATFKAAVGGGSDLSVVVGTPTVIGGSNF